MDKIEFAILNQMNQVTLAVGSPFDRKIITFSINKIDLARIIAAITNAIDMEIAVNESIILTVRCGHLIITYGRKIGMIIGADALSQLGSY